MKRETLLDIFLLTVVIGIFYSLWLGSHPLMVPDEGRYAEVTREMIAAGNYITPHINGTVLMDKPIFFYWLQASAFKLFGLNEWAARMWPALIGVLGCLVTYIAASVLYDRRTGILAAIILATSPLYFCLAHYANLDIEVGVFVSMTLLLFLVAIKKQLFGSLFLMFYLFIALAILTKGLIGIILPALIIGTWIIILNYWRVLIKMHLIIGFLVILIIAAPWYLLMQNNNPDFLNYFFINQQFGRYLSQDFNNAQPIWFYLPILLIGLFPWLFFLPQTLAQKIRTVWQDKKLYQIELFLLLWPLIIILFFTLPHSKTIGYIVPATPPLAILIGHTISNQWQRFKKWFYVTVSIGATLLVSLTIVVSHLALPSVKPLVEQVSTQLNTADEIVVYEHYYYDLPFYLRRTVGVVTNWSDPSVPISDNWQHELWQGSQEKSAVIKLYNTDDFLKLWQSNKKIFVFTDDRHYYGLKRLVNNHFFLIKQYKDVFLVSNQI